MTKKIYLAASVIGFALAALSSTPTHAIIGGGAFAPIADSAFVPVADVNAVPAEPRRWRSSHRRSSRARPSRPYYEPYAYYPAYRYGGAAYGCCEAYAVDPAYDPSYSYSYLGRYYYEDGRRFHLRGFHSGPPASYYYW
jgi:hypothetical protein